MDTGDGKCVLGNGGTEKHGREYCTRPEAYVRRNMGWPSAQNIFPGSHAWLDNDWLDGRIKKDNIGRLILEAALKDFEVISAYGAFLFEDSHDCNGVTQGVAERFRVSCHGGRDFESHGGVLIYCRLFNMHT